MFFISPEAKKKSSDLEGCVAELMKVLEKYDETTFGCAARIASLKAQYIDNMELKRQREIVFNPMELIREMEGEIRYGDPAPATGSYPKISDKIEPFFSIQNQSPRVGVLSKEEIEALHDEQPKKEKA